MKKCFFYSKFLFLAIIVSVLINFSCRTLKKSTADKMEKTDTIIVSKGESFKIIVRANPSTGYDWQMDEKLTNTKVVIFINQNFKVDNDAVGSPGNETWNFKTIGTGETSIKLTYLRSWIPDKPAEIKIFKVLVK
jgi:predicted secreted protein